MTDIAIRAACTTIALDLADNEQAFALAQTVADETGQTVTVRDVEGKVLGRVKPSHLEESRRVIEQYADDLRLSSARLIGATEFTGAFSLASTPLRRAIRRL